jgi:uncharacterized protein
VERRVFLQCVGSAATFGAARASDAEEKHAAVRVRQQPFPHHSLGRTGVKVSAMALGGVAGMQQPPSNDHDPVALAEAALDLGIAYFDTAPAYNNGQSECNYGGLIARRRTEVFLATKTGDRTYDGTMRSIEQSFKRLRTDQWTCCKSTGRTGPKTWRHGGSPTGY